MSPLFTQSSISMNFFICDFRSLKSKEKRIHRQLYVAMLIQIVIRLILYTDQYITRLGSLVEGSGPSSSSNATDTEDATGRNESVIEDDNRRGGEQRIARGIDNTVICLFYDLQKNEHLY